MNLEQMSIDMRDVARDVAMICAREIAGKQDFGNFDAAVEDILQAYVNAYSRVASKSQEEVAALMR